MLAVVLSAEGVPGAAAASAGVGRAFTYPESAARALGRAAERAEWLRRPAGRVRSSTGSTARPRARIVATALAAPATPGSTPAAARALLDAYGVPLVAERLADERRRARSTAARELGFPVVVKTAARRRAQDGDRRRRARPRRRGRGREPRPSGSARPVVVQPMVTGGTELLAGVVQDPTFGPLVAFGPGGVLAELIGEARSAIAPLTDADADELAAARARPGVLVAGFRGAPAADAAALADLLHRLSPARRGPSRGRRARPQPRARAAGRLRRRRRARPRATPPEGRLVKTW